MDKYIYQSGLQNRQEVLTSSLKDFDLSMTFILGNFDVVLNDDHFMRLIMQYVQPPAVLVGDQKSLGYLVQMGFPSVDFNSDDYICLW